jgi:hypothetical protein
MRQKSIFIFLLMLSCSRMTLAQADRPGRSSLVAQTGMAASRQRADRAAKVPQGREPRPRYRLSLHVIHFTKTS